MNIRKNDLVTLGVYPYTYRRARFGYGVYSHEMRELFYKEIRETGDTLDSGGEPRLAPMYYTAPLVNDRVYIVIRARASPPFRIRIGAKFSRGMCLLLCTHMGSELYAKRHVLKKVCTA